MNTRVLITGGGKRVISLIDTLMGLEGVILVGICDVQWDSPGMKYASKLSLPISISLAEAIEKKCPEIIIETSGSKQFQDVLHKIAPKRAKIVDSKAAELLLNVAHEKEKAKRYGQLYLVDKLSKILSAEYDTHNVVWPIFNLLRETFNVDLEAIMVFYNKKDELLITSEFDVSNTLKKSIINRFDRDCKTKIDRRIKRDGLEVFSQIIPGKKHSEKKLESFVSIPLVTSTKKEGMMVLASTKKDAFNPEDVIVLHILADELALFVENERMKRDLADAKNSLESMLHGMNEGVIALDEAKRVTLINPMAKELLKIDQIKLGCRIDDLTIPKEVMGLIKDIASVNDLKTSETTFNTDGTPRTIRFYSAKVTDSLAKPNGWIMLLTDITKEKEIDRMKSEFISTTSHELRTPLAAIKESVMLILDGTTGRFSQEQGRFLNIAKRNITRLTELINDLLDIAKIETGRMDLKITKCNIKEIVGASLESMKILAMENQLKINEGYAEGLPEVELDRDKVIQIITNLVSNAIKYTPAGGRIDISVKRCKKVKEGLEFSVTDTGMGIDKKHFSRLFTRFGQLDGSLTRRPGGTGLGLAICKELVIMHGGKIWVQSKVGKGSVFTFTLPIKRDM